MPRGLKRGLSHHALVCLANAPLNQQAKWWKQDAQGKYVTCTEEALNMRAFSRAILVGNYNMEYYRRLGPIRIRNKKNTEKINQILNNDALLSTRSCQL